MFELEGLKQENLVVRLGIPAVYGGVDANCKHTVSHTMNPEDQFIADLKTGLGDNYSVNVNSYDMTEFFKKNNVGPGLKPEDVFTIEQLDKWATDNGYVKFY